MRDSGEEQTTENLIRFQRGMQPKKSMTQHVRKVDLEIASVVTVERYHVPGTGLCAARALQAWPPTLLGQGSCHFPADCTGISRGACLPGRGWESDEWGERLLVPN